MSLDPDAGTNGPTPLHNAVWHEHLAAERVLVEAGAPLDARIHASLAASDMATLYGYGDILQRIASHDPSR